MVNFGEIDAEERFGTSGRRFLVVRRSDVDEAAVGMAANVDMLTAARLLGLSESRLAAVLPTLIPDARQTGSSGCPWSIPRNAIDSLIDYTTSLPKIEYISSSHLSLERVLRAWPLTDATLAKLLLAVLKLEIVPVGQIPVGAGVTRIAFDREEFQSWYRSSQTFSHNSLTIPEVADRLSIKQEVAYFFVRNGLIKTYRKGKGCHAQATVRLASLCEFDKAYVFARDLAKALNTSSKALAEKLSQLGIEPKCGPNIDSCRQILYERGDALDHALQLISASGKKHTTSKH